MLIDIRQLGWVGCALAFLALCKVEQAEEYIETLEEQLTDERSKKHSWKELNLGNVAYTLPPSPDKLKLPANFADLHFSCIWGCNDTPGQSNQPTLFLPPTSSKCLAQDLIMSITPHQFQ